MVQHDLVTRGVQHGGFVEVVHVSAHIAFGAEHVPARGGGGDRSVTEDATERVWPNRWLLHSMTHTFTSHVENTYRGSRTFSAAILELHPRSTRGPAVRRQWTGGEGHGGAHACAEGDGWETKTRWP